MKKILFTILTLVALHAAKAQCSSCTINLTGTDNSDYIVSAGEVLCIPAGATATGHLLISGGRVCNQGNINNTNIFVSAGGELDNYGNINSDSLLVRGAGALLHNYGHITDNRMSVILSATFHNNGYFTCNYLLDSNAALNNYGNITINNDAGFSDSALAVNTGYMQISGNFYNTSSATFTASCMLNVSQGWYNMGTIDGPASGCGGFNIAGPSYNTGTVAVTGHIDICNAAHALTANTGVLGNITYCQCPQACTALGINVPAQAVFQAYPNPAAGSISLVIPEATSGTILLQNLLGKTLLQQHVAAGTKEVVLSLDGVSNGFYLLIYGNKIIRLEVLK